MAELYDFVWPTLAILIDARSRANERLASSPTNAEAALKSMFMPNPRSSGYSGIQRANFKRSLVEISLNEQEQIFARLVLVNIFANYEGWLIDLYEEISSSGVFPVSGKNTQRKFIESVQFPYSNTSHKDWAWAIGTLKQAFSADLEASFGTALKSNAAYAPTNCTSLLHCYRLFKELRNAVCHQSGNASAKLIDALIAYNGHDTAAALGMTPPIATKAPIVAGQRIVLSLFGVVGFNQVIQHLMTTLDIEAGLTTYGEFALQRYFSTNAVTPSISGKRESTIARMVESYGLPKPVAIAPLDRVFKRHSIDVPTGPGRRRSRPRQRTNKFAL